MINTLSEKELLSRVTLGDPKAFAQLYSQYLNGLYRYIYLFTKSKVITEETIQKTLPPSKPIFLGQRQIT